MPLLIHDKIVQKQPSSVKEFHQAYDLKDPSRNITEQKQEVVGPKGLLYVGQREYAGTIPEDDVIKIMGSEDATTCHVGILRHTGSGATSLLHFDGCETQQGLNNMVQLVIDMSVNKPTGRLELHLVGGFEDDRKNSENVSQDLICCLMRCEADIHLMTACIGEQNTVYKNKTPFPIVYGIAVEVDTGRILNATFPDQGPDMPLRSARHFGGDKSNLLIYNWKQKQLTIGPFTYSPMSDIDFLLSVPDQFYRKYMSTSPDQEPATFESHVRACLQHMRDHPDPMQTQFQGNAPRCYRKLPDGRWEKI